jgi:uncharacterized protein YjbJ (UPF0337 family)
MSREAEKIVKKTKGQVEDAVDKASDAVSGAVKGVQALM